MNNIECPDSIIYLSECLQKLPYGIIECQFPRIGITYLELHTERNSIILFPNKKKAIICSRNNKESLYIDSETSNNEITTYKLNSQWKKFIVTPESLKLLMQTLQEEVSTYFFLIKGMEELQSNSLLSSLTISIGEILDYYIIHPKTHRCICTIDSKAFSHPALREEDISIIDWTHICKRNITIFSCTNIVKILKETIEQISSKEKILVIYTSAQQAKISILNLKEEFQKECCILCNESNKNKADKFYIESTDKLDSLPKRITFLGDSKLESKFEDIYHLITISDAKQGSTLLSQKKIIKAYDLCTNHQGILSDTIVHNTRKCFIEGWDSDFALMTLRADKIVTLLNMADKLSNDDEGLKKLFSIVKNSLDSKSLGVIRGGFPKIPLVRKNIEGKWDIAYMNMDNILARINLYIKYYHNPESLNESLRKYYSTTMIACKYNEKTEKQEEIEKNEKERSKKEALDERLIVLNEIKELYNANLFDFDAFRKINKYKSYPIKKTIQEVKELYTYIDTNELVTHLKKIKSGNNIGFKNLKNAVVFAALEENHSFKADIYNTFKVGDRYTNNEIAKKLAPIIDYHFHKDLSGKNRKLITLFKSFFDTSRLRKEYLILSKKVFIHKNRIPKSEQVLLDYFNL